MDSIAYSSLSEHEVSRLVTHFAFDANASLCIESIIFSDGCIIQKTFQFNRLENARCDHLIKILDGVTFGYAEHREVCFRAVEGGGSFIVAGIDSSYFYHRKNFFTMDFSKYSGEIIYENNVFNLFISKLIDAQITGSHV